MEAGALSASPCHDAGRRCWPTRVATAEVRGSLDPKAEPAEPLSLDAALEEETDSKDDDAKALD